MIFYLKIVKKEKICEASLQSIILLADMGLLCQ